MKRISIFGGTGYLGTVLTTLLAKKGHHITLFSRRKNVQTSASCIPNVKCVPKANMDNLEMIKRELKGSDIVINLMGTWDNNKKRADVTHHQFPVAIYELCHEVGVQKMIHFSALGAEKESNSTFFNSKRRGDEALLNRSKELKVDLTIVRPSLVLGHEDPFSYKVSCFIDLLPVFPLPMHDATVQPVVIDDLMKATELLIKHSCDQTVIDIAGAKTYSLFDLVTLMAKNLQGTDKGIVRYPNFLTSLYVNLFGWVWGSPINKNHYLASRIPSTTEKNDLPRLGIEPTRLETLFPHELEFKVYDKYNFDRSIARR
ncbi:NAD(P)H-binding protein [Ignatzschineria sp. RMDPL8A]|uniref:NAD-dependent epimerase/dehydratase family protein n=1 Tax=Ignatzschineria sp. RMDPL8A TaxID=2999236 RepID=UPI0016A0DAD2|nr:NAD-dependent epimerase/dehydratase family protein [Ignatzschineria sp. RMDPL8A]MDG9730289.1 NAD(P)H-binding protein [Ignatzschineria sp. RMDPL8A]NLD09794.1 NAD(P)H-binding protein [Xanthomonadaceae bacterium]